eukprot:COSAG06_NODE_49968_length_321_cov_47.963964_1_plen_97_part_01
MEKNLDLNQDGQIMFAHIHDCHNKRNKMTRWDDKIARENSLEINLERNGAYLNNWEKRAVFSDLIRNDDICLTWEGVSSSFATVLYQNSRIGFPTYC